MRLFQVAALFISKNIPAHHVAILLLKSANVCYLQLLPCPWDKVFMNSRLFAPIYYPPLESLYRARI